MGAQHSHFHLKLLEKVEEAYIDEAVENSHPVPTDPSTTPSNAPYEEKHKSSKFQSLTKQLWKKLEHETDDTGTTSGYLNDKQAKEFFEESYEYFKKILQSRGIYFNPSISKEQIISEWISAFDLDKDKKLSYAEFVHALQVMAQATHPEIAEHNAGENPILHETFTYDFFVPPNLKKYGHDDSKSKDTTKFVLPLELTGLGVELVVDGFEGSGVRTLVKLYAGPITPKSYAQCNRDLFNKDIPIPVKVYLHPARDNFQGDYLPVTQDYPFRFHLIVLVFDMTAPVNDAFKVALNTRIAMIKKYLDQTYEQVPHPPLLFLGNKMEEVKNFPEAKKEFLELAEKYHAMFSSVSAKTGLFVSKSFREALIIAIGNRFGYALH